MRPSNPPPRGSASAPVRRRRGAGWLLFALVFAGCGSSAPGPATESPAAAPAHAWRVYDGEVLVLEVSDTPGPLLSTALPPPGVAPPSHPFLSGSARSAAHESRLRTLLDGSSDLPGFLSALEGAGFRVEPRAP